MKKNIMVIFGGKSTEHDISILSAMQVFEALDTSKYDVYPVYITKNSKWLYGEKLSKIETFKDFNPKNLSEVAILPSSDMLFIKKLGVFKPFRKIDCAFIIMHGMNGEDGTLQGYLELVGIPYVGSGVLGSSLGQDKVIMKQVFQSAGIPIVDYTWFYDCEYYADKNSVIEKINKLGYPVIVKPATLGSSVGITFVKNKEGLEKAIAEAINYDVKIVVEKAVENLVEVNCSVLGNYENQTASVLEEVMSTAEFLTYQDKYIGGKSGKTKGIGSKGMAGASRIIPARLDDKTTAKIQNYAKEVFKTLNLGGVCRIDFLVDSKTKKIYVNEPNTIPGSLSFYLWDKTDKTYPELLDELITIAIKSYKFKAKKTTTFDTNILSNFGGVKGTNGLKGVKCIKKI